MNKAAWTEMGKISARRLCLLGPDYDGGCPVRSSVPAPYDAATKFSN